MLPEIGMTKPLTGSFNEMVDAFAKIVAKNPALAQKQGWPTTREAQENWLDEREAQRMIAGGYFGFVELEGQPPPSYVGGASRRRLGESVAAAVSGLAIYRELFANKSVPVAKEEAERRAGICVTCPLNKRGGLREFFVEHVAKGITELYGVLREHNLISSRDKDLGTCAACMCPTQAKIHIDLATIHKHMKPDVLAKLAPQCWITAPPVSS